MSIVTDLFDRIRTRPATTEEESHAWDEYLGLLKALSLDEMPDYESAKSIIQAVGKHQHEVEADVQQLKSRLEQRRIIDKAQGSRAELRKVEREIQKLHDAFNAAKQDYMQKLAPLNAKQFELTRLEEGAASAERSLKRTILDQRLLDEIDAVQRSKTELQSRINAITEDLRVSNTGSPANNLSQDKQTIARIEAGNHGSIRKGSDDHQRVITRRDMLAKQVDSLEIQRNALLDQQHSFSERLDELMQEALQP